MLSQHGGWGGRAGSYVAIGEVPFGHTSDKVCEEKAELWAEAGEGEE